MVNICIDNSFLILLLTKEDSFNKAQLLWREWQTKNNTIIAPKLIYYEASNVLHRLQRFKQIDSAQEKLNLVFKLNIKIYEYDQLHQDALTIAERFQLPAAYDAHYLALAEKMQIDFYTCDKKLFNSAQQNFPRIKLVATNSS
ncbi:type II toxin-antitoxin system VapC family toxin [Synechocystis sp. FACHB-383]|uniref:type II toxin-antitoxin system VapC family toxin n=1 Tax=Synechocystis sp. FACHB-383 TaxID=2692864 RepID=UPI001686F286|nr:type II toxin-antitoxin system VapC family toxin [Synechocystis sp. FACHB-383]MBD2652620.1 type II toxin-antitoxin system VapC family toxin [Synechocystis sp. FACHB-383]